MLKVLESSAWLPDGRSQRWGSKWIPTILDEELFPVHDTSWDELIAKCNSPSFKERSLFRGVLNTDGSENFKLRLSNDIAAGRTPVIYIWGGQGVGKSFGALPIEIIGYEAFLDEGIETRLGVWSTDYPQTVTKVSEAERLDRKYHIHQDEDPDPIGAGAIEARKALFADINQLRKNRISLYIIDPVFNPEFLGRMLYGLEVIGRNDKTGATLYIVYTKSKYPLYYMIQVKRSDFQWLYDSYDKFKEIHSHEIARHGGAVSATNITDIQNRADDIVTQLLATRIDLDRLTEKHIFTAASEARVSLPTTPGKLGPIILKVRELWSEKHPKPNSGKPAPQHERKQATKTNELDKSKRGYSEQRKFWTEYLPDFFKGTGAKIIYKGKSGQTDGLIKQDGTTYVCDSKDYNVPLTERRLRIQYRALIADFDQYEEEIQRGEAENVILCAMVHEGNRDLWFVAHIPDAGNVEKDSQGRPLGSLWIDLPR